MNAPSQQMTTNPFASAPVVAAPTGASAGALMSREAADVATSMMLARQFPRDERAAMDKILINCTRETLAEESLYQYSRGGQDITGPSIRLAEELARSWGNMRCGVAELSRHGGQSEVLAYAEDLETGFRDEKRFVVRHWRDTKSGGHVITEERDIYEHIANMGSRRKRACILSVVPIDVQEAAVKQCEITLNTGSGSIEPERVKAMLEGFSAFGVTQEMIEKRIARRLESLTPALMTNLRKIYASLKDNMSVASQWFETVNADTGEIHKPAAAPSAAATVTEKLRAAAPAPAPVAAGPAPLVPPVTPSAGSGGLVYPQMTMADSLKATLQSARTVEELKNAWKDTRRAYLEADTEIPLEVDAAYNDRKASLEQSDL